MHKISGVLFVHPNKLSLLDETKNNGTGIGPVAEQYQYSVIGILLFRVTLKLKSVVTFDA